MSYKRQTNRIAITNQSTKRISVNRLKSALRSLLVNESRKGAEISILLCDDIDIKELNKKYRGINEPTDVLSFPQNDETLLGDIAISIQTAYAQAKQRGVSLDNEVIALALHGCLHLLGYDHATSAEQSIMINKAQVVAVQMGYRLEDDWGSLH